MRSPTSPRNILQVLGVLLSFCLFASIAHAGEGLVLFDGSPRPWPEVSRTLERMGGRVLQAFPPGGALIEAPEPFWSALPSEEKSWRVFLGPVPSDRIASLPREGRFAAIAWNRRLAPPAPRAGVSAPPMDDAAPGVRGTPGPSKKPPGAGFFDTSEFMLGSVAIAVLLPESNGAIDPSSENWTTAEIESVFAEVQDGMGWWIQHVPGGGLSFVFRFEDPVSCPYEPITRPAFSVTAESLWVRAVFDTLGYDGGDCWFRASSYLNDLRDSLGTDWAVAVFVADSKNDVDEKFSNGYYGFSYYGGPYLVMTYDNGGMGIANMDAVAAHEVAHSFYAIDEYFTAHKSCTLRSGYEFVANQNSDYGTCLLDETCIMRANLEDAYDLSLACLYTRGQVGIWDDDNDSIPNILDTDPSAALDATPDTTGDTTPSFTGFAHENPLLNRNPLGDGSEITLNTIVSVEYRIDGGSWTPAGPADGLFDSTAEAFSFTTEALAETTHIVEVRAVSSTGNTDIVPAADTFVVVDVVAPGPVLSPAAVASDSTVVLTWTNPPDPDLAFVMIRFATDEPPPDTSSGVFLARRPASPSAPDTVAHGGLFPDTTYHYAFFSLDEVPNPSGAATAAATPLYPPPPATLHAPAHGALHVAVPPTLVWSPITLPDPADTLVAYAVQVALDSLFSDKLIDTEATVGSPADTSWETGPLATGTVVWWRVRGKDFLSGTYGLWSVPSRFATELPVQSVSFLDSTLSTYTNFAPGDSLAANADARIEARVSPADTLGIGGFSAWVHWTGAAADSAPLLWDRDEQGGGFWRGEIPFGTAFDRGDTVLFFVSARAPGHGRLVDDNGGTFYRFVAARRMFTAWHVPQREEAGATMRDPFIPVDTDTGVVCRIGSSPAGALTGGDVLFRVASDTLFGVAPLVPGETIGDTSYLIALLDSAFLLGDLVEYYVRLPGGASYDTTFLYGENAASFRALAESEAIASPFSFLVQSVTTVEEGPATATPARNELLASRPNPFNPATTIPFALSEPGRVTITLYDARGRVVRGLIDEALPAGRHAARWDGRSAGGADAPSGVYFAVIRSGVWRETSKMLLVR